MNNERYNQIIDEVYEKWIYESCNGRIYPNINEKEQFINRIKTEPKFSERWGLKIEERCLSWEERDFPILRHSTKLITVTYQENKIEIYD